MPEPTADAAILYLRRFIEEDIRRKGGDCTQHTTQEVVSHGRRPMKDAKGLTKDKAPTVSQTMRA
jgi:hypothetical protein